MNGITPLQYSNAPIQMMSALASDIQQQNILNQKRYQEEFNQGLELARMISPEVLNKSFDAQVVNAGIVSLIGQDKNRTFPEGAFVLVRSDDIIQ